MCQDVRNDKTWLRYWILEGKYIWAVTRGEGGMWYVGLLVASNENGKSLSFLAKTYYFFKRWVSCSCLNVNVILNSWNYKIYITVFVRESHSYDIAPCLYSLTHMWSWLLCSLHLTESQLSRPVPAPQDSLNHISLAAACSRRVDPPIIILSVMKIANRSLVASPAKISKYHPAPAQPGQDLTRSSSHKLD